MSGGFDSGRSVDWTPNMSKRSPSNSPLAWFARRETPWANVPPDPAFRLTRAESLEMIFAAASQGAVECSTWMILARERYERKATDGEEGDAIMLSNSHNFVRPASECERAYLESLFRVDYERCHPGETLEDMKLRAPFSKEDGGLLRDWMAVAAMRAAAERATPSRSVAAPVGRSTSCNFAPSGRPLR